MDISIYFKPIDYKEYDQLSQNQRPRLGNIIEKYSDGQEFPSLRKKDIAIFSVKEGRGAINNEGCANGADEIRKYLYDLFPGNYKARIVDLGDIQVGNEISDTYYAVTDVVSQLLKIKVLPIIIGGGQNLSFPQYKAYEKIEEIINILAVDSEFDIGDDINELSSKSYLSKIIMSQPNYLFNYTNIGYQTYFVDQESIQLINKLFFEAYRLGEIRADMKEVEPLVRNTNMLTFDISSIRMSDAPGNNNAGPNGFFGDEACRIAWYAGMSDKLSSFGIYEYNPEKDVNGQTAHLISQMIWYFIEGFYNRKDDFPTKNKNHHMKFMVQIQGHSEDLIFYKSKITERWWIEVMNPENIKSKFESQYIIPCSYNDYEKALKNEIPDRWWQAYQKLM